jgi:hypothetical protein
MKYDNMSDNEINVEVWAWLAVDDGDNNMLSGDPLAPLATDIPDYCNSWADAGPIIAENQISIYFDADLIIDPPASWVMCHGSNSKGGLAKHYGQPDKPLRAAMIVFLMMQEEKSTS